MGLLNPSFEEAGAGPGEAADWTLVTFVARERIAGFGDPCRAWEGFAWSELVLAFDDGDLALAFFDPLAEGFEDFRDAWDNDHFLLELPSGQVVAYPDEPFEIGWANDDYATAWAAIAAAAALFDGELAEDFPLPFAWDWASATAASATFDGGADSVEDFVSWTT